MKHIAALSREETTAWIYDFIKEICKEQSE